MAQKVILSEQFKLKALDFLNGAILAVGTPLLYLAQELIPDWDANPFVKAGISALIAYLIKNFFTKPQVITTYSTNDKAASVAEDVNKSNGKSNT